MLAVHHVAPRRVETREVPDPDPGPGEVVVRLGTGGICGSDLHVFRRDPWKWSPVLGHEPAGVVHRLGEGVEHLAVGDRVTLYHYQGCGHCRHCRGGEIHWCKEIGAPGWHFSGSCGEQVVMKAANALPLPDALTLDDGALIACGAGTTWSALRKVTPTAEDTAVVFGLGPIGLCGVAMLKAFGCRVIAIGRRTARLRMAEVFGADRVIDIDRDDDPVATVRSDYPDGVALAYETTGQPAAQRQMINTLGYFGRAACVGIGNKEPAVNLSAITGKQLTLRGSHVMNFAEYDSLARFMIDHDLRLHRMVTHRFPFAEGQAAFDAADSGDSAKVVLSADV